MREHALLGKPSHFVMFGVGSVKGASPQQFPCLCLRVLIANRHLRHSLVFLVHPPFPVFFEVELEVVLLDEFLANDAFHRLHRLLAVIGGSQRRGLATPRRILSQHLANGRVLLVRWLDLVEDRHCVLHQLWPADPRLDA